MLNMGNCLRKNQISSAQDEDEEVKRVKQMKAPSISSPKLERKEDNMKKKVRFKTQDGRGGGNGSCGGGMRIRVVVTKEELKRVLSNKNENDVQHTSLEQLLNDMKLREKSVSKIEESDGNNGSLNSWRPALDSIPEDRSMK